MSINKQIQKDLCRVDFFLFTFTVAVVITKGAVPTFTLFSVEPLYIL